MRRKKKRSNACLASKRSALIVLHFIRKPMYFGYFPTYCQHHHHISHLPVKLNRMCSARDKELKSLSVSTTTEEKICPESRLPSYSSNSKKREPTTARQFIEDRIQSLNVGFHPLCDDMCLGLCSIAIVKHTNCNIRMVIKSWRKTCNGSVCSLLCGWSDG